MHKDKAQNLTSGFSLVELMVTFIIMSFIVWSVYSVFNMADNVWNSDMGIVDLQQDARQAMDRMINEIRQTKDFSVGNPCHITDGVSFSFCVPVNITNVPVIYSQPIVYSWVASLTNLPGVPGIERDHAGTKSMVAANIDSLNFSLTGDIVNIDLTSSKTVRGRTLCFPSPCGAQLTEKVRLRNE